jgi:tRNA 2-thiocytidine biosynthesis protein TtcA
MNLEKRISRTVGKAIRQYEMIEEHDRILVAVSGGKDSLTMLYDLLQKQKCLPIQFALTAYHLETNLCNCPAKEQMTAMFEAWHVDYRIGFAAIRQRLKPGQEMGCFFCSSQRRMELLKYAREHNYNKIALGHHLDDIVETFLLNILYKGEYSAMLPKIVYDKDPPVTIIRPLALVREEQIREFTVEKGFKVIVCSCPYETGSMRKKVKAMVTELSKDNPLARYNILASMSNANSRFLF